MRWRLKVTESEIKVEGGIEIEIEIKVDPLSRFQSLEVIDRAKTIIAV